MSGGEFTKWLETSGTNVYIKGLPAGITQEQVKTIFGAYGTIVSCKVLASTTDTCPAMVLFEKQEEAQWIVDNLNNNLPQGLTSPIMVKFATSAADKAAKGYGKASWKGGGWDSSPYGGKGGGKPDMSGMMEMMKMMMSQGGW
eukprot:gnl/TRDRNA2_/TRDRNA2_128996_c0_seq1.p1 gnl/TRDRNA2_/TRDRNA2_128996_c0~~gnl/TRDRNA2_/TRDRNA2_128996_c0_seq1.p1  ORF type:complete len:153 (-),score=28.95 gnl/TRDRNA2_/TRDRNA2_128996_c0_seq1:204-632(-)